MLVYLLTFASSAYLFSIMPRIRKEQRRFILFLAICIPCLIAGIRANSVGTDVNLYLKPLVDTAIKSASFSDFYSSSWYASWEYVDIRSYEIGFLCLVYIFSQLFRSIYAVQFAIQLLTILPVYYALNLRAKNAPIWFGMLTYFFFMFNPTLNMMRQGIGMAFTYLAIQYFISGNKKLYFTFQIVAILFHTSAIIGLLLCSIYIIIYGINVLPQHAQDQNFKLHMKKVVLLVLFGISILGISELISNILATIGLSKYINYISGKLTFMPNQIIAKFPIIIMCIVYFKKLSKKSPNFAFLLVMLAYDLIFSQYTSVNPFSGRIAMYFSLFYLTLIPDIYFLNNRTSVFKNGKINIPSVVMYLYLLFYWWFYIVYEGIHQTIPFAIGF